jgi:hypothetical protein
VRTGSGIVAIALALGASASAARADDFVTTLAMDYGARPKKLERTYSQQIEDRLTALGEEIDTHCGKLSFDRVAISVDGRGHRAKVRLGKGGGGMLSMRIDGDVKFEHGLAEVDAKIDLSINGYQMQLDLPRFDLVPTSYQGEKYLEVRLPLISGTFEPETWFQ